MKSRRPSARSLRGSQYALALLAAVQRKKSAARHLDLQRAPTQGGFRCPRSPGKLEDLWGTVRTTTPADKLALMRKYRNQLDAATLRRADRAAGGPYLCAFAPRAASCSAKVPFIGLDLTGSQRANLEYVLQNVVDPSAIVGRDYRLTLVTTGDGRVITGIIKKETESTVIVQTPTQLLVLAKTDIEARQQSPISMMPEGVLETLQRDEVRDLVGYLASPGQVDLPAQTPSNQRPYERMETIRLIRQSIRAFGNRRPFSENNMVGRVDSPSQRFPFPSHIPARGSRNLYRLTTPPTLVVRVYDVEQ